MKALSIQQPWAWLIVQGIKRVENRTWSTQYRGELLIHAPKTFDRQGWQWLIDTKIQFDIPAPEQLERGGIVGHATLVDCVDYRNYRTNDAQDNFFAFGPYCFILADAKPLNFTPYRGQLGIFDVPATLLALPKS